jgi:hypothetical protein
MGTYKPNINCSPVKMNHCDQPEIISFNIEYIPVISYKINVIERFSYSGQVTPIRLFSGSAAVGCIFIKACKRAHVMITIVPKLMNLIQKGKIFLKKKFTLNSVQASIRRLDKCLVEGFVYVYL